MIILTAKPLGEGSYMHEVVLWIIFTCNIICGMGSGVLLASLFSFAALFPWEYTQSVMGGLGLAGAVVSIMRVLTKVLFVIPGQTVEYGTFISTVVMFSASVVLQFICMILFYVLVRRPITTFYTRRQVQLEIDEEKQKLVETMTEIVDPSIVQTTYGSVNESNAKQNNTERTSILLVLRKLLSPGFGVCKFSC
jgi:large-conductance mechanosensitive channel